MTTLLACWYLHTPVSIPLFFPCRKKAVEMILHGVEIYIGLFDGCLEQRLFV